MATNQFHIVVDICRAGLAHIGSRDFRRQVARLRNALAREGDTAETSIDRTKAGNQVASLTELLERYKSADHYNPGIGDLPTPETVAKLKPDSILEMLRRGTLDHEHLLAADELRDVFQALVSGLTSKGTPLESGRMSLRQTGPYRQPIERMPERLARLYYDHYKPWAEEMENSRYGSVALLELTIDVVVDGHSLHDIERKQAMRNGSASKHLRAALQRYAEIAGWLTPEPNQILDRRTARGKQSNSRKKSR